MENMHTATIKKIKKVQGLVDNGMKISQALKKAKLSPRTYYDNQKKLAETAEATAPKPEPKPTPKKPGDPGAGPMPLKEETVRVIFETGTEIHCRLNQDRLRNLMQYLLAN